MVECPRKQAERARWKTDMAALGTMQTLGLTGIGQYCNNFFGLFFFKTFDFLLFFLLFFCLPSAICKNLTTAYLGSIAIQKSYSPNSASASPAHPSQKRLLHRKTYKLI